MDLRRRETYLGTATTYIAKVQVIRYDLHLWHYDVGLDIHQNDWPKPDSHRQLAVHGAQM